MISVGIDVSKDKHDCFIVNSEGEVLADVFTIHNTMDGFNFLLQRFRECTMPQDKIKVGLEATGHYSYNLIGFLLDNGLATYVLNPLRTNLYRKSLSLRKTKTDRVDARTIAHMLLSDAGLKPYTDTAYPHMEKRGSRYLRYALYNATKCVCHWNPNFAAYLAKKRAEGKHYIQSRFDPHAPTPFRSVFLLWCAYSHPRRPNRGNRGRDRGSPRSGRTAGTLVFLPAPGHSRAHS